ncbi:MAG: thioredoxin TrxC [Bacteriovorax sp.]|nr:thioredoxin TrxC [Bacteriovorax sp.]
MNDTNTLYTFTCCAKCHAVNKIAIQRLSNSQGICGKCKNLLNFHQLVSEVDNIGLTKIIQKSDLPVIVDFWAPWCGPCVGFAPTYEAVSKISQGKIVFIKINTEQYPEVSSQFNIRGIPTLLVFKNNKEIARESGAFPLETFKAWVNRFY